MRTDAELLAEIESDADIDPERLITDPDLVKAAAAECVKLFVCEHCL
ncbi:hypothetical protein [Actinotignum sp. GS-2025d]